MDEVHPPGQLGHGSRRVRADWTIRPVIRSGVTCNTTAILLFPTKFVNIANEGLAQDLGGFSASSLRIHTSRFADAGSREHEAPDCSDFRDKLIERGRTGSWQR
jgi:hypothetical protein